MNNLLKIVLGILVIVLAFFGYTLYRSHDMQQEKAAETATLADLNQLVITKHDCPAAITKAQTFLQTYPEAAQVWILLGSCQINQGNFSDAKTSFQKVLALDPANVVAKNYMNQLNIAPGEVLVAGAETPVSQKDFETKLGVKFSGVLAFEKALQKPSNVSDYAIGTYLSSASYQDTVAYVKKQLDSAGITYDPPSTLSTSTIFPAMTPTSQKTFSISKIKPVRLTVTYIKH